MTNSTVLVLLHVLVMEIVPTPILELAIAIQDGLVKSVKFHAYMVTTTVIHQDVFALLAILELAVTLNAQTTENAKKGNVFVGKMRDSKVMCVPYRVALVGPWIALVMVLAIKQHLLACVVQAGQERRVTYQIVQARRIAMDAEPAYHLKRTVTLLYVTAQRVGWETLVS